MTLEQKVRDQIGSGGPQLAADEYEKRIDEMLEDMSARDLLRYISLALEDAA